VTRVLRPGGLALFGTVAVLLVGGWVLLADPLARHAITTAGTALVGAEVDLDKADVGLFPPRLALAGLAVTDPDAPMTNAFQVARAELSVNGGALLGGRFVVDAMRVEGVRLHTPRARSGAIKKAAKKAEAPGAAGPGLSLPGIDLPDLNEILNRQPLASVQQAEALAHDLKGARAAWEERVKSLPGQDDLDRYRERLKELKANRKGGLEGILKTAAEAKSLAKDVEGDVKTLRRAGDDLKGEVAGYRKRAAELADAPAAEARRLTERYRSGGALGVGTAFLNQTAERWTSTALAWYRRLGPLLERAGQAAGKGTAERPVRGRGHVVRFPEVNPAPNFWVREATVSVAAAGGEVRGTVRDVTTEPRVLGKPVTFAFAGDGLTAARSLTLDGLLDRTDPDHPDDRARLAISGAKVHDMVLSRGKLPVTLAQADADLAVDAHRRDDALNAEIQTTLAAARFAAEGATGEAGKALTQALEGVRKATVDATVTGTVERPRVAVRSDLDRVLAGALKGVVDARVRALEGRVRDAIAERIQGRLTDARQGTDALDGGVGGALDERRGELEALLSEAMKSAKGKLPF
jgi:uncharacterized protein (TIGR03545 family)